MTTVRQITALLAVGAVALTIISAPSAQATAPKYHRKVVTKTHRSALTPVHVGTKIVLVPSRRVQRSIKVQGPPATKDTPGLNPTVPPTAPGGSPDPRPLGMPNGVGGTGVPGPGTTH